MAIAGVQALLVERHAVIVALVLVPAVVAAILPRPHVRVAQMAVAGTVPAVAAAAVAGSVRIRLNLPHAQAVATVAVLLARANVKRLVRQLAQTVATGAIVPGNVPAIVRVLVTGHVPVPAMILVIIPAVIPVPVHVKRIAAWVHVKGLHIFDSGMIKEVGDSWQSGRAKSITFIVTKDCQLACK